MDTYSAADIRRLSQRTPLRGRSGQSCGNDLMRVWVGWSSVIGEWAECFFVSGTVSRPSAGVATLSCLSISCKLHNAYATCTAVSDFFLVLDL